MPHLSSAPDLSFATIADALKDASAGDTILLQGGTYEEALDITTDGLRIGTQPASSGPVVIRSHAGPVITARGKDIVLSDLSLQANQADCLVVQSGSVTLNSIAMKASIGSGLVLNGPSSKVAMHACIINGVGKYGCLISDGAVADAKDCIIKGCKAAGVVARGKGSIFSAHGCTMQKNGKLHHFVNPERMF